MDDIRSFEHPTLKVPYEWLNKRFRLAQKCIDRDVSHVQNSVVQLEKTLKSGDVAQMTSLLSKMEDNLVQLKTKCGEAMEDEVKVTEMCKKRIEHIKVGCSPSSAAVDSQWKKTRIERLLVEYFLRSGYYDTAVSLAKQSGIEDLTNISLFLVAKEVEDSLASKDMSKCLAWCHDNKSRLRKMRSTLEFNVRLQEFIELVKTGMRLEAVKHARKYLATEDGEHLAIIQKAMALLVFPAHTTFPPYRELLTDRRWTDLILQFRTENYKMYQLSNQSAFSAALKAGLSALKTPHCYRSSSERNLECPVCQQPFNELATSLPFAHCSQSKLFCNMSGGLMNENNHPMMLPNGFVYGETALNQMALENEGQVVCPRTKDIFPVSEAEKIYVM